MPSRTLSAVILRMSTNSTALPGWVDSAKSFMNLSSMPKSDSEPPSAPVAAPMAAPAIGIKNSVPINMPQKPPETAPTAVVLNNWFNFTWPSAPLTAMTASPISMRYSFCISNRRPRTVSASCSLG